LNIHENCFKKFCILDLYNCFYKLIDNITIKKSNFIWKYNIIGWFFLKIIILTLIKHNFILKYKKYNNKYKPECLAV
jgi:hypothetical protein